MFRVVCWITATSVILSVPWVIERLAGSGAGQFDMTAASELFEAKCSRCHVIDGGGSDVGPNLSMIGKVAESRKPGMTAAQYIAEAIIAPQVFVAPGASGKMPTRIGEELSDNDVRNLVAFLVRRGGTLNAGEIMDLQIPERKESLPEARFSRNNILLGETVFKGKGRCIICHSPHHGAGFDLLGPALFSRGLSEREEILKSIQDPNHVVPERYRMTTIVCVDGTVFTGRLLSRSETDVTLLCYKDQASEVVKVRIADIERDEESGELMLQTQTVSPMPKGIPALLSKEELDSLVIFILSMN